jgi:hypothetical protein
VGKRSLKRRIESLRQRIAEHKEKIAFEEKQLLPDVGLLHHWKVEIRAFNVSLQRAIKRLA